MGGTGGRSTYAVRRAFVGGVIAAALITVALLGAGRAQAAAPTIVSLGFDDGYTSQYDARTVLAAHDMRATFFLMSGSVGTPGYMTWAQAATLAAAGHEIGGHTVDHLDLTTVSPAVAEQQVCDDRDELLARGFAATSFAYPYGNANPTVEAIAEDCGYTSARITGWYGFDCPSPCTETVPPRDPFATTVVGFSDQTNAELQTVVTNAEAAGGWAQIVIHGVCDSGCAISSARLNAFLGWLSSRVAAGAVVVRTIDEVMSGPDAPQTSITAGPSGATNQSTASFSFTAGGAPGVTFGCLLDGPGGATGSWGACTSPTVFAALADGSYTFRVRAANAGGADPTPATRSFTVDTLAPAAPVIGAPADGSWNATGSVVVSGSAEAGASVEVFRGGVSAGSVTANGAGAWSKTLSGLADGPHVLTARASDAAGNASGPSVARTVKVDTAAPGAPVIVTPAQGSWNVSGSVVVSGTAEAGGSVEVFDGGVSVGSVAVNGAGAWSKIVSVGDGTHVFTARASDPAGNVSAPSAARTVKVDTVAPAVPVIGTPVDGSWNVSGSVLVSGSGEAGASVEVFDGGVSVGSVTANGAGAWSKALSGLADGPHVLTARVTDPAGNVSGPSVARTVKVDTVAPGLPVIGAPAQGSWSVSGTVMVSGTAEAGGSVEVFDGGVSAGSAPVNGAGVWSKAVSLADGSHALTARASDAAGNASGVSAARTVKVDTVAPGVPVIATPVDGSWNVSGSVLVSGSGEAGASVEVFDGGVSVGSAPVNGSGAWSKTLSGVADGSHVLTARVTDPAGNVSGPSVARTVKVDTVAPGVPVIGTPVQGSWSVSGSVVVSGTAEAGASVELFDGGLSAGSVAANGAGAWSKTVSLADGSHALTARASDAAGNVSGPSVARTVKVDTVAPGAPVIGTPADASWTASASVVVSGTAEAGGSVEVLDGGVSVGSAVVSGGGAWSTTLGGLSDGPHVLTARVADAAGNVSPVSAARTVKVDTVAPGAPVLEAPADDAWSVSAAVVVSGTAEAGASVELLDGGVSAGSVTADGAGAWSKTVSLADGSHTFSARASDPAGNVSAPSDARTVKVDTVAPDAAFTVWPSGTTAQTSATFAFSGAADVEAFTCAVDGEAPQPCTSPVVVSTPGTGAHSFEVRARDAAGNVSAAPGVKTWSVDPAWRGPVTTNAHATAGGVVASPGDPAAVTVTTPVAGLVSITTSAGPDALPPGFAEIGAEFAVTAPEATAGAPLLLTFRLSGSLLPVGTKPADIAAFRDGAPAAACSGPGAEPDPCVVSSTADGADVVLVVRSSRGGRWTFGPPLHPVPPPPSAPPSQPAPLQPATLLAPSVLPPAPVLRAPRLTAVRLQRAAQRRLRVRFTTDRAGTARVSLVRCAGASPGCGRRHIVARAQRGVRAGAVAIGLTTPALAPGTYRVRLVIRTAGGRESRVVQRTFVVR